MVPIVNETIDSRLRNRRKEVVYKLYIEKPYDHVNALLRERERERRKTLFSFIVISTYS